MYKGKDIQGFNRKIVSPLQLPEKKRITLNPGSRDVREVS